MKTISLSMMILMNEMIIMLTVGRRIQPANIWHVKYKAGIKKRQNQY